MFLKSPMHCQKKKNPLNEFCISCYSKSKKETLHTNELVNKIPTINKNIVDIHSNTIHNNNNNDVNTPKSLS